MATVQVTVNKSKQLVGQPLKRTEDPKLITGMGMFVDDVRLSGTLVAAFVRSPHAHAKINKVDVSAALKSPGVVAVLTSADLKGVGKMPTVAPQGEKQATDQPVLAISEVNYMGEAVAAVIAESAYAAEDAVELVEVDYDTLDAVVDVEDALRPGSPKVHEYLQNNVSARDVHDSPDIENAFKQADEIIRVALVNQRVAVVPMEPRAILASYDQGTDTLTIYLSTQDPHGLRDDISELLGVSAAKVRVIAPDVGGGFGAKASVYREDAVVSFASMKLKRPVKWIESRMENLMTMTQGRGQRQYAEVAVRRDGKILGLRTRLISDTGAYSSWGSLGLPGLTYLMGLGAYEIPAYASEVISVFTNKVPQGAYRGAGRPEAAFLIERCVNIVARRLNLDPVEVRERNYIPKEKFPFKSKSGTTYDSGDYETNLLKALDVSDYQTMREDQRVARAQGRLVGIGLATWLEIGGFGPSSGQSAAVTVNAYGDVTVIFGGSPQGQGHETPFSQIVADELGVGMDKIRTAHGDTAMLPWSTVTAGSRSAPVTGSAVKMAAGKVRRKMETIAAFMLKLPEGTQMTFAGGKIFRADDESRSVEFEKVADAAYNIMMIPRGMEPTIFEYAVYTPVSGVNPFGTHVAMVEVDKETGVVKLLKYFAVDDVGKVLNPMVVEGQVHGGVIQGLGQAMLEQVIYDENGQLLTSTLADYVIPSAEMFPNITAARTETPTSANALGIKGIGEGGTTGATPAYVNAVEDALSPYAVTIDLMPLRADYVKSLIDGTHKQMATIDLSQTMARGAGQQEPGGEEIL